jgi:hypothetical protein
MKRTINIATFPSRENELKKMLKSIKGQFDETRLYFNNISERPKWIPSWVSVYCGNENNGDLTDNGKFFFLEPDAEEYYFTADDDIYYPPTYADDMVKAIERTNSIVTHHGRKLTALNVSYYRGGHKIFMCLRENKNETFIDVAGTGVTAFDTRYFNPTELWANENLKMSDMIFSHEATRQGKRIKVLKHEANYFVYLFPAENTTIHQNSFRACPMQTKIANEIYILKHGIN